MKTFWLAVNGILLFLGIKKLPPYRRSRRG